MALIASEKRRQNVVLGIRTPWTGNQDQGIF